jgi:hypothetical protein
VNSIIDDVITEFKKSDFKEEAERLVGFQKQLLSSDDKEVIFGGKNIIGLCHPKAWGDLNMVDRSESFSSIKEWDETLDRLKKHTNRIIKKLK